MQGMQALNFITMPVMVHIPPTNGLESAQNKTHNLRVVIIIPSGGRHVLGLPKCRFMALACPVLLPSFLPSLLRLFSHLYS